MTRRKLEPADCCPRCGEEWSVRWHGRWWCVACDAAAVFGEQRGEVHIRPDPGASGEQMTLGEE